MWHFSSENPNILKCSQKSSNIRMLQQAFEKRDSSSACSTFQEERVRNVLVDLHCLWSRVASCRGITVIRIGRTITRDPFRQNDSRYDILFKEKSHSTFLNLEFTSRRAICDEYWILSFTVVTRISYTTREVFRVYV